MLGSTDPVFLLVLLAEHRSTFKMLTLRGGKAGGLEKILHIVGKLSHLLIMELQKLKEDYAKIYSYKI